MNDRVFLYEINDAVSIKGTPRNGTVIGRAEYLDDSPAYFVRYVNHDGDVVKKWFGWPDLELVSRT